MPDDDKDPLETQEWRDALGSVVEFDGPDRASYLLKELNDEARRHAVAVPVSATTPYVNTIPVDAQPPFPGDLGVEHTIRSLNRWNAVATVLRANKESSELGGHIASFQSSATLYDTGFNHFWHGQDDDHGGDLLFVQGHVSPGIYARSFLEGRISEYSGRLRQQNPSVRNVVSFGITFIIDHDSGPAHLFGCLSHDRFQLQITVGDVDGQNAIRLQMARIGGIGFQG